MECLENDHDLLRLPSTIFRLCNDLATSKVSKFKSRKTKTEEKHTSKDEKSTIPKLNKRIKYHESQNSKIYNIFKGITNLNRSIRLLKDWPTNLHIYIYISKKIHNIA